MKKLTTKKLSIIGLLSALTILLGLTPLGYIPFPVVKVTTLPIPTIIGAIIEGPMVGGIIGLVFGLFSMFQNFTAPTLLSFMFWNPLVSVLPRILIGVATGYLFKFLKKSKLHINISVAITGAVGAMVNTVGVLGMAFILFADRISTTMGGNAAKVLIGIASTNAPIEIITTTILILIIGSALIKVRKNGKF